MQNVILIIENFLEKIVITVTDELSHCGAVSTVKTTPKTATNKCFHPLTIGSVRKFLLSNRILGVGRFLAAPCTL